MRGLTAVTGLALDGEQQLLYWSDGELNQVNCLMLNEIGYISMFLGSF